MVASPQLTVDYPEYASHVTNARQDSLTDHETLKTLCLLRELSVGPRPLQGIRFSRSALLREVWERRGRLNLRRRGSS